MSTPPTPKVSHSRSFPLIWVVPVIALGIGLWIGIRELSSRGPEITIDFANVSGVESGKTVLEYKGVTVGMVTAVRLKPALDGAVVTVRLRRSAARLAAKGTQFWVVHPEIGFAGVRALDTLVTGVRLNVRPGQGPAEKHFRGLEKTPPPEVTDEGRIFTLRSEKLGSLSTGSPVFYREFKVGQVESSHLAADATAVLIRIHIDGPYVDLVRTSTKFWNAGGFNFKVNLFGAELKDTSLESLVTGGVAFATPDTGALAPVAADGDEFALAAQAEKEWQKWAPQIMIKSPESTDESRPRGGLLNGLVK